MSVPTVSLYDLLEELRARDEAIDSLVVAYFKLEKDYKQLKEKCRVQESEEVVDNQEVPLGSEDCQVARLLDRTYGQQSRDGLHCG